MVIQYAVERAVHAIIYEVHEGCIGCSSGGHMTLVAGHMTLVTYHMIWSDIRGSGHVTFTDDVEC